MLAIEREYKDYGATTYPVGGKDLVSVSSVLGRWHSYGMERMKLRLAVDYGRKFPHLDADAAIGIAMREGGEAARHGKEVHSLLERFEIAGKDAAEKDNTWEQGLVETWDSMLKTYDLTVVEAETLLCNMMVGYGGRTDRICHHPRYGHVVVDIKTGKMSLEYILQLAAYANTTHRVLDDGSVEPIAENVNKDWAVVALLPRDEKRPKMFLCSLTGAFEAFKHLHALHLYETGKRHAAGRPWQEMSAEPEPEMSLEAVLEQLGADANDAVEQYLDESWAWLRAVVRTYSQREREALAGLWPVDDDGKPIPTFKAVANDEAPRPSGKDIEKVELAMVEVDAMLKVDFRDTLTRPLPPRDATLEECPPVHFRIDAPHPQRVAEVAALFNQLTPKEKKSYSLPKTSTRPKLSQRSDIPEAVAEIERIISSRTTKQKAQNA